MIEKTISYYDGEQELEGFLAYESGEKRPLVILCHAWRGRDAFIEEKAREIARLGYVGFALDMYGKGVLGNSKEENAALKKPFLDDRMMLKKRLLLAYEATSKLECVDSNSIAALGCGFGALCALDLARAGVLLKGAISIYGHFEPTPFPSTIKAKILILHGYDDPVVDQTELTRFQKELNEANVDWQVNLYGNTLHAFANPSANDPAAGLLYNPLSAARAWKSAHQFLQEIL